MKYIKWPIILSFLMLITSCEEDDEAEMEPERQNVLVQFENNSGDPQQICYILDGEFYPVVFVVSYRDIQADLSLGPDGTGFLVLNVEDGEEVNVRVQGQADDVTVANASVVVRTESRPESLWNETRIIAFCNVFDLQFFNF